MKTHRMFLTRVVRPQSLAASLVLLALVLAMAASNAPVVHAATHTVTVCSDGTGDGTLRWAINQANSSSGGDLIDFDLAASCTISLGSSLPTITKPVNMFGPGQSDLILDGQNAHNVFVVMCSSAGCNVNISDLTIQNATADTGSAIYVASSAVYLGNVTVQNNTLDAIEGAGAPIYCTGNGSFLALQQVTASYNSATANLANAGALMAESSCSVWLDSVVFDHNSSAYGAGAMSANGAATLNDVSFTNNTSTQGAGGMRASGAATLNAVNFTNNTTALDGGALYSSGTVAVTNSQFTDNSSTGDYRMGGAIYFSGSGQKGSIETSTFHRNTAAWAAGISVASGAQLTVKDTTFDGNTAAGIGGAILNSGTMTATSVTFNGNHVTDLVAGYGGAVFNNGGQMTLTNATFDGNSSISGSALVNGSGGTLTVVNNTIAGNLIGPAIRGYSGITLKNTIVSSNPAGNCDPYAGHTITDGGGNLNWESGGHVCPGISVNPQLDTLGNDEGPVWTRALLAGSGAINVADATTCAAAVGSPTFGAGGLDARGAPRRAGFCDIGAFEAQPNPITMVAGSSPQSTPINTAFAQPLSVSVRDMFANALGGVAVTYAAPASGASAVLSATSVTSNASGIASVTATANGLAGSYSVTAKSVSVLYLYFNLTNTPGTTTTNITSHLPDSAQVGQTVTVTFSVTSPNGTPTGNVTVNGGTKPCMATVAVGSCTVTFPTPGSQTLRADYGGDGNFAASSSSSHNHTVVAASTAISITSHLPHPSRPGQAVTVLYTVTSPYGTPTGTVTVSDGTTNCTGTVAAGSCSLTFTSAGSKTITATYAGDGNYAASTASSHAHTVLNWGSFLPLLKRP